MELIFFLNKASAFGYSSIVQGLLHVGAKVNMKDSKDSTAIMLGKIKLTNS